MTKAKSSHANSYRQQTAKYTYLLGVIFLAVIILRLFYLQVIRHDYYDFLADGIRSRIIPSIAPRGIIYDRNGIVLAESKLIYSLDILPYQISDQQFVLNFLKRIKIDTSALEQRLNNKSYLPYELISVKRVLEPWQISYIEENKSALEGVVISTRIVRYYPQAKEAAHVLGYVGQIGSTELSRLKNYGYQMGDIIGLAGIERYYDSYLRGVDGGQSLEVDKYGNPVRNLHSLESVPGHNIYLTIDFALQQAASRVLGDRKGAIVIVNPQSGEVLAMVSKPDYDPNYFTDFLSEKEWQELRANEHPLYNRALGSYPPGSTFKIVTFMAALEDKIDTARQFFCNGHIVVTNRRFDCWYADHGGHGKQNLLQGFVNSCNIVFYNLGLLLTPQKIADTAAAFGLGVATNIDLPFENNGFVPTERWKKRRYNQEWFPGDSLNMAIGQGYLLTTPLQMTLLTAAVADEQNRLHKPYILNKVLSVEGKAIVQNKPESVNTLPFTKANIELVRGLMRDVVDGGTGSNARVQGLVIRGKTGTAENQRKDHAWFVSYGPYEKPDLAMAVFVEEGGFGGTVAARIARDIYTWYDARAKQKGAG
ncbi:penicillin-binding protein 2 superfamily [Candidatus Termititenax spirochaetophilus]|uniref:Penicillin-binding protein 2 superfamily n=1 Tax=Candidatus Termititenax spirochaetophilus TaxID=2218522 RepID=A0A388T8I3_9BACT|nr:penicillin-binding protein 2 superfamily [Candidatus Termititenax spirochaetophilus]